MKLTKFKYDELGVFRVSMSDRIGGLDVTIHDIARNEAHGVRRAKRIARKLQKLKANVKGKTR